MENIKFGTDGWRGVIADDFTFANVSIVAQAIADYYRDKTGIKKGMAVGYDTRFLSKEFAERVSEVLAGNGISVILSSKDIPTQCISFAVKERNLTAGIMITASHNPPKFNGIKIKGSFGGSVLPEITNKIEALLGKNKVKSISLKEAEKRGLIKKENLINPYLQRLRSFLDEKILKKISLKIVYDSMFGVGEGLLKEVLESSLSKIITIHPRYNPGFGGLNPEPIEENLKDLKRKVREEKADLGIASDGDADRLGVIDNEGRYLTPHQVFSLLLLYLIEERGLRGKIAKTVSLGYQPERIARKFNLPLRETPVGFKFICEKMLKEKVLFGGEESGGYGFSEHLPERDGILSALFLIDLIQRKNKPLSQILKEMEKKFGNSLFRRVDFEDIKIDKRKMVEKFSSSFPPSLGGIPLREVKTIDGVKFIMKDESWLLIRPSGTEPKVRVYAEAPKKDQLDRIINEGKEIVKCMRVF